MTAPRSSYGGVPSAANSPLMYPTPTPNVSRPPHSWSAVLNIFASRTGLRYGTTRTSVPNRSRDVDPAPWMQQVSGSNQRGGERCAA